MFSDDAFDAQAMLTQGRQLAAARDEHNVIGSLGEATTEVAADRAGAEDRDPHRGDETPLEAGRPGSYSAIPS